MNLDDYITKIPDHPKPGVLFRDITSLLANGPAFHEAIDQMAAKVADLDFDVIIGSEARGFIFGTPLAYLLKKPFVLVRKKGKLPRETVSVEYDLEYGTATLEMHRDAIRPGQRHHRGHDPHDRGPGGRGGRRQRPHGAQGPGRPSGHRRLPGGLGAGLLIDADRRI